MISTGLNAVTLALVLPPLPPLAAPPVELPVPLAPVPVLAVLPTPLPLPFLVELFPEASPVALPVVMPPVEPPFPAVALPPLALCVMVIVAVPLAETLSKLL